MHMADALLSPAVGGAFYLLSGTALGVSAKKLAQEGDERKAPMMGVLGAFVFAGQMINFTIPGTGSSGHMVGGMLLMMLLGPYAAFITLASVILIQALFFADGGLLALGANIWNMGFYPCFVGYWIYRLLAGRGESNLRLSAAAILGAVVSLELGALSVVLETVLSGLSDLPFGKFLLLMMGIHFPIGIVEGLITVAVVNFVLRLRPEALKAVLPGPAGEATAALSFRPVLISLGLAALVIAGVLSWFASAHPDGLEWSLFKATGQEELTPPDKGIMARLANLQEKTSFLPDYQFKPAGEQEPESPEQSEEAWPSVSAGTTASGIIGSAIVLLMVALLGFLLLRLRKGPAHRPPEQD